MKKINEVGEAAPRFIGHDFARAKAAIAALGTAITSYEAKFSKLNGLLQNALGPMSKGLASSEDRIKELEAQYEELRQTSEKQLAAAQQTISDLRKQLAAAQQSQTTSDDRLQVAAKEMESLNQEIHSKTLQVQELMGKIDRIREKAVAASRVHDDDRKEYIRIMDAYEARIEELTRVNAELEATAKEATERFNKLLGGVTAPATAAESVVVKEAVENYRNYGGFDFKKHLERASKRKK